MKGEWPGPMSHQCDSAQVQTGATHSLFCWEDNGFENFMNIYNGAVVSPVVSTVDELTLTSN